MGIKTTIFTLFVTMLICLGIGISIMFFTNDDYLGPQSNRMIKINQYETYDLNSINDIDIKAVSSEIKLIPVSGDNINIKFYGSSTKKNAPKLVTKEINDKLLIEIIHPTLFFNIGSLKDTQLDIEIPSKYHGELEIDTVSGDIFFKEFELKKLDIDLISGNIEGELFTSNNIYLESVSGDINLNQFMGALTTNTISGDVTLNYQKLNEDLDIETISGDVKIYLPINSDFYLDYETISGNINNQFAINVDSSDRNGLQGKVGSGISDIDVDTVSGNLNIYN